MYSILRSKIQLHQRFFQTSIHFWYSFSGIASKQLTSFLLWLHFTHDVMGHVSLGCGKKISTPDEYIYI